MMCVLIHAVNTVLQASSLIEKYGLPWAFRIVGLTCFGICCLGTVLVKDRIPRSQRKHLPIKSPIQPTLLKNIDYDIWLVGAVVGLMGYLTPMFYLPSKS